MGWKDWKKWPLWPIIGMMGMATVLRLYNLNFHSLDLDESVSVWLAHKPALELIRNTLNLAWDPHPPAYYLMLKGWMAVWGSGEVSVRLLSALFGIAFVGLVYLVGRRLFDAWTGRIAAALCAINPLLIWLSQEVRMYMPAATLSLGSLYCLLRACDPNSDSPGGWWVGYAVLALLACYSHLFAVLLLPVAALYVLTVSVGAARRRRAMWWGWGSIALVGLAYLPFAWNAWQAGQVAPDINVYPRLDFIGQVYHLLLAFAARYVPQPSPWLWVGFVLLGGLMALGLWPERPPHPMRSRLLLAMGLLLPLTAFFWIIARRPAFNPKYMVNILPLFWLAVAAGIRRLSRYKVWPAAPALLVPLILAGLGWPYVWSTQALREDWRTAAQYVSQRATSEDTVFVHLHYAHIPFDYYYRGQAEVVAPLGSRPPAVQDLDGLLSPFGGAGVLWLVQSQEWNTDPQHVVERWFFDRGPIVTEQYPVGMSVKAFALRYRLGRLPDTAQPAQIAFGSSLRLAGYELDQTCLRPNSDRLHPPSNWIHLTLYWQVDWPLESDFSTTVEMTDDGGGVWGGKLDQGRNVLAYYRPSQWQPGELVRDDYDLNLNPVTPAGMYHIRVGVQGTQDGLFWPVSGAAVQGERAVITMVSIEPR